MATMPTEPANLNPPVTPWGQALTMKELQVFRPATNMTCLGVSEEYSRQRRRHEGPLTDAAFELQHAVDACLMDAMTLQRTHCAEMTLEYASCVETHTTENRYNKAPWKCIKLRRAIEDCVVNNKDYMAVKEKYDLVIDEKKVGEKGYLKLLRNWKDKTEEEKDVALEKLSVK